MAYSIKGNAIINDSRAILGVSTAGINTALYVGGVKIDGETGEVISTSGSPVIFVGDGSNLTGVVTVSQGGGGGGDTPTFEGSLAIDGDLGITGIATISGNLDLNGSDILNGGTGNFADLVVSGTTTLGTALSFTSGAAGEVVTGISTDLDASAGATELVTAEGAKSYVDAQLGGGSLLEIEGDNGVQGVIDLANDEVFGLDGTANQIETEIAGVGFNTVTFTLADELQLPGTLAFAAGQAVSVVGVETSLVDGVAGVATNTSLPTQLAVKTYVDAQIAETGGSVSFAGDSGSGSFDISDEVFNILGTTNQVVTSGAGLTVTVALPDDVQIALTLGANISKAGSFVVGSGDIDLIGETAVFDIQTQGPTSLFQQGSAQTNFTFRDDQFNDLFVLDHSTAARFASVNGRLDVSAGAVITGVCTATDFNSTSDINKKENIVEIADALEKVEALRGVTFDWKDGTGKSGGIIAQDVQAVLPEIVKEGEHLTVNYNGLTGLLIEAVKELTARVAELEGKA